MRSLSILLLLLLCCQAQAQEVLRVLNWKNYIDSQVLADFEQFVRGEFRKVAEDLRATERRQEDHRRQTLKEISAAMELMAQNVRRLTE